MESDVYTGWDLGGAHLKLAQLDRHGRLVRVRQLSCRLWTGLPALDQALDQAMAEIGPAPGRHAVTMTGELADIFRNREEGVRELVKRMRHRIENGRLKFFAGGLGLLDASQALEHTSKLASANWLASAGHAAQALGHGILVDIGSTTTDIVLFTGHRASYRAFTDGDRLCAQELLYTGVSRTPVMAVVRRVPFHGEWQLVAAERFATMADVYRLSGQLLGCMPPIEDDTADGGGIRAEDCARRLARMLGRDAESAPLEEWSRVAHYIAGAQSAMVREALERMLSRVAARDLAFVGAGVGRFIVRELAIQLHHPYIDFSELIHGAEALASAGASCAPAVALAYLMCS